MFGFICSAFLLCTGCEDVSAVACEPDNSIWVRPQEGVKGNPHWGFKDGIQIGIAPLGGPRGLIRIYTPYTLYTGPLDWKVFNFIAFEPTPHGAEKGFSEMEPSAMDGVRGKRFWSGNTPDPAQFPDPQYPASGVVSTENGVEKLSVYIFSEKFANGADVYVKVTFSSDNPHQIELETYRAENSPELQYFVLSATMGNYARLRTLYLDGGVERVSTDIWPDYTGTGFTRHHRTKCSQMLKDKTGGAWYVAAPNEKEPGDIANVPYAQGTHGNWLYYGLPATQYWYCPDPSAGLTGAVNGRYTYWASSKAIPGGISFENFEMQEDFRAGQKFIFGVTLLPPEKLINKIKE